MISRILGGEKAITVPEVNLNAVILLKQRGFYGILTKDPNNKWFITDLFNANSIWGGPFYDDPKKVLESFVEDSNSELYQFDTKGDFINWLWDNVPV